jgi:arginyl-tRNA synthetase
MKVEEVVRPEHEARKKAREVGQDPSILENQGLLAERDAFSKQIENGEPESMTLWKKFRDVSIGYYQEPYTRLNIKLDEYAGESQVSLNSEAITEVSPFWMTGTFMKNKVGPGLLTSTSMVGRRTSTARRSWVRISPLSLDSSSSPG